MLRLGILGSTRGTNLLAIIDAIQQRRLPASIEVVISNKPDAMILERARANGLLAEFISPTNLTREEYDQIVSTELKSHAVDLIVLIGYMRILSNAFVGSWKNKMINVHPSLLPAFEGKMDLDVHRAVLQSGIKETGCTVHYVTEEVDQGPIILQKKCPVLIDDTPESLKARIQVLEGDALVEVLKQLNSL
jgi:phosphoribosylglycinamide formyltransferase-1